jgi:hypothetical protein
MYRTHSKGIVALTFVSSSLSTSSSLQMLECLEDLLLILTPPKSLFLESELDSKLSLLLLLSLLCFPKAD